MCTYDSVYALRLSDTTLEVFNRREHPFEYLLGIEVQDQDFYITTGENIWLLNRDFEIIDQCAPPELPPISAQYSSLAFVEQELYIAYSAIFGWTVNGVDFESCHATEEVSGGPEEDVRGLTWDGSHFWLINYNGWTVLEIDSATGERTGWFSPPDRFPTGLDWDGTHFWLAYRRTGIIQQISVNTNDITQYPYPLQVPNKIEISSVYPNPFNGELRIQYQLNSISGGQLVIYNITGREIRRFNLTTTLAQSMPGVVTWDGCDRFGNRVSSGIYFVSLGALQEITTEKVLFMK
ncbi:T9SS type A sorting domain-containing protein [bacterium]|nr:T9SS type A sorting domain-containing protein [bacterium]